MSDKTTRDDSSSPFLLRTSKRSTQLPADETFAPMLGLGSAVPEDGDDIITKEALQLIMKLLYSPEQNSAENFALYSRPSYLWPRARGTRNLFGRI